MIATRSNLVASHDDVAAVGSPTKGVSIKSMHSRERWFVFQTSPHREAVAEAQLAAQNYIVFVPRIARTIKHARQWRNVVRPCFPRYGFVALDLDRDQWSPINGTRGVTGLITACGRPVAVPPGVVEALLAVHEGGITRIGAGLTIGDRARVVAGPFSDMVGKLDQLSSDGRVRLLIEMMNRVVPITVRGSVLAPVA